LSQANWIVPNPTNVLHKGLRRIGKDSYWVFNDNNTSKVNEQSCMELKSASRGEPMRERFQLSVITGDWGW
jgi:hypothetical protein